MEIFDLIDSLDYKKILLFVEREKDSLKLSALLNSVHSDRFEILKIGTVKNLNALQYVLARCIGAKNLSVPGNNTPHKNKNEKLTKDFAKIYKHHEKHIQENEDAQKNSEDTQNSQPTKQKKQKRGEINPDCGEEKTESNQDEKLQDLSLSRECAFSENISLNSPSDKINKNKGTGPHPNTRDEYKIILNFILRKMDMQCFKHMDSKGNTALHYSAVLGCYDTTRYILEHSNYIVENFLKMYAHDYCTDSRTNNMLLNWTRVKDRVFLCPSNTSLSSNCIDNISLSNSSFTSDTNANTPKMFSNKSLEYNGENSTHSHQPSQNKNSEGVNEQTTQAQSETREKYEVFYGYTQLENTSAHKNKSLDSFRNTNFESLYEQINTPNALKEDHQNSQDNQSLQKGRLGKEKHSESIFFDTTNASFFSDQPEPTEISFSENSIIEKPPARELNSLKTCVNNPKTGSALIKNTSLLSNRESINNSITDAASNLSSTAKHENNYSKEERLGPLMPGVTNRSLEIFSRKNQGRPQTSKERLEMTSRIVRTTFASNEPIRGSFNVPRDDKLYEKAIKLNFDAQILENREISKFPGRFYLYFGNIIGYFSERADVAALKLKICFENVIFESKPFKPQAMLEVDDMFIVPVNSLPIKPKIFLMAQFDSQNKTPNLRSSKPFRKILKTSFTLNDSLQTKIHNNLFPKDLYWKKYKTCSITKAIKDIFDLSFPDATLINTYMCYIATMEFSFFKLAFPTRIETLALWLRYRKNSFNIWFIGYVNIRGDLSDIATHLWKRRLIQWIGYKISLYNETNGSNLGSIDITAASYELWEENKDNTKVKNAIKLILTDSMIEVQFDNEESYEVGKKALEYCIG